MNLKNKFKMLSLVIVTAFLFSNFGWKTDIAAASASASTTATTKYVTTTVKAVEEVPELLITEVMPMSQNVDDAFEYIELYNNSNHNIDLKDYKCFYPNYDFNTSKIIPPKGVLVICTRYTTPMETFNAFYGTNLTQDKYITMPFTSEMLNNSSLQNIILSDDNNKLIAIAKYEKDDFDINKSVTYKYPESGFYMQTLGKKQNPTPGTVAVEQIPFDGTRVTGIVFDKTSVNLEINQAVAIIATVAPITAINKTIQWSSNNPNIARVNEAGVVTAVSNGVTVITGRTQDGGHAATCQVIVGRVPVTGVFIEKSSTTVEIGKTIVLTANITPSNATNKLVVWTSGNSNIAIVDNNGLVTGKSEGNASIYATTVDGNISVSCSIQVIKNVVSYIPVSGVDLNKKFIQATVGHSEKLIPTVLPVNATNKTVTWVSDNPSIANVDMDGKITAYSNGMAMITVKTVEGNYTNNCIVIVDKNNTQIVTSIRINKQAIVIKKGKAERLVAIVSPANIKFKAVNWKSSNTQIATVDSNGRVYGIKKGNAIITATMNDGSCYATCSVSVTNKEGSNNGNGNGNNGKHKGNGNGNNKGKGSH